MGDPVMRVPTYFAGLTKPDGGAGYRLICLRILCWLQIRKSGLFGTAKSLISQRHVLLFDANQTMPRITRTRLRPKRAQRLIYYRGRRKK